MPSFLPGNPVDGIPRPVYSKEMDAVYLTEEEVAQIFHNVDSSTSISKNRDKAILMLGFLRGLSNSEIASLNLEDVDIRASIDLIKTSCFR